MFFGFFRIFFFNFSIFFLSLKIDFKKPEYSVSEFITNSLHSFTDLKGGPSAPVSEALMGRQSPASSATTGALAAQEAASPRSSLVATQQPASYWALDRSGKRSCHNAV